MLFTGSGPLVILTSYESATEPSLLKKLAAKGIDKFIAYEIPLQLAERRYGGHFFVATHDLHEVDDLRILDFNGERAFRLFHICTKSMTCEFWTSMVNGPSVCST
jgi:hypothetical protein